VFYLQKTAKNYQNDGRSQSLIWQGLEADFAQKQGGCLEGFWKKYPAGKIAISAQRVRNSNEGIFLQ
jgi:hypothetical protein